MRLLHRLGFAVALSGCTAQFEAVAAAPDAASTDDAGPRGRVPQDAGPAGEEGGASGASERVDLFVSPTGDDRAAGSVAQPLATLPEAVRRVAALGDDAREVVVSLDPGVYELAETLVMGPSACGRPGRTLLFRGTQGTVPGEVVVSGGRRLERRQWQAAGEAGLFEAEVEGATFRDLYAGARRLVRARTPEVGAGSAWAPVVLSWLHNEYHQLMVDAWALGALEDGAHDFEVVLPVGWAISRLRVLAFARADGLAYLSPYPYEGSLETAKGLAMFGGYGPFHGGVQRFWLEGSSAWLDEPGEWVREGSTVRLLVDDEAVLEDVRYPILEQLLRLEDCSDVTFEGLVWQDTGWAGPASEGWVGVGTDCAYRWTGEPDAPWLAADRLVPAAIEVSSSRSISFSSNRFSTLGGAGIVVFDSDAVGIEGSLFTDVAGGGIRISGGREHRIQQNVLQRIGFEFASDALAVNAVSDSVVATNHFADLAARAIYLTDAFFQDAGRDAASNTFFRNRVDGAVRLITDAGAINSGGGAGFELTENHIRDVRSQGWNTGAGTTQAVYLDIGSYQMRVSDNRIEDVEVAFQLNCQGGNEVSANSVSSADAVSRTSYGACTLFRWWMSPDAWTYLHWLMTGLGGCSVDEAALRESCACNSDFSCGTDSIVQGQSVSSEVTDAVPANAGPDPEVFERWDLDGP